MFLAVEAFPDGVHKDLCLITVFSHSVYMFARTLDTKLSPWFYELNLDLWQSTLTKVYSNIFLFTLYMAWLENLSLPSPWADFYVHVNNLETEKSPL
jgi:hypothetical protein